MFLFFGSIERLLIGSDEVKFNHLAKETGYKGWPVLIELMGKSVEEVRKKDIICLIPRLTNRGFGRSKNWNTVTRELARTPRATYLTGSSLHSRISRSVHSRNLCIGGYDPIVWLLSRPPNSCRPSLLGWLLNAFKNILFRKQGSLALPEEYPETASSRYVYINQFHCQLRFRLVSSSVQRPSWSYFRICRIAVQMSK